jgi:outer membrane usher protein FimD/PapC
MKVQDEDDSVARKVMLLNNLAFSSSYNLMADSFNLAPISISANTNVLNNKLNINLSASLDPYNYVTTNNEGVTTERRVDELAWKSQHLGRITNATLNVSTNLNPKKRSKDTSSREKISQSDMPEHEKQYLLAHPDVYVDFDIPWSLNLAYNLNYQHSLNDDPKITQAITANGTLALSEKWQLTYSTGYHVETKQFTTSNFGISRDLHCWTFNLNWTPFGYYQSYNVTIAVKSAVLRDLKVERRKPFFDNPISN